MTVPLWIFNGALGLTPQPTDYTGFFFMAY
jgi:hypothetical protein